jgi:ATP/maltotriose-dependent transcriptional regulator MalT
MSIDIISTKLVIPKRPPGIVRRARLIDYLHENLARKLLLITAPAGYGKTTLLIDFANDTELPVCWYTLDDHDRDPTAFVAHLVASIRQKFPDFGAHTQPMVEHGVAAARAAALALVEDMTAEVPEYFVLALDDWHAVSEEAIIRDLIDHLLRYLPEHAHLIIAGRTLVRGPLIRLAAHNEVAGLGASELRFNAGEVRELLASQFKLAVTIEQARKLADEAEGWITAILLSSHSAWHGVLSSVGHLRDSAETLYEYLAGEVFDRLEPPLQQFLLASAVPGQFTAAMCDAVLERSGAAELIGQAETRNLFLTRIEAADDRWYRYHPLFREFLSARLRRDDASGWQHLQRRVGEWYEVRHQIEEAIDHFLTAGAADHAAQLMDGIARRLYNSGRIQTLHHWIDRLPPEQRMVTPELILLDQTAAVNRGQRAAALPALQLAEAGFRARGDQVGQLRARLPQGWLHYVHGQLAEALQIAQAVLHQIDALAVESPTLQAEALRLAGVSEYGLGRWPGAVEHLTRALDLYRGLAADNIGAPDLGRALQDLANVLRSMGRLEEAAALQAESLTMWRTIGNPDALARCLNNMGYDRYVVGDYDGALKLYVEALTKAEEADHPLTRAWVLDSIAAAHRDRGEFQRALDLYTQVLQLANEIGDQTLISWVLDGQGHVHRLMDDLDRAVALFEQAVSIAARAQIGSQINRSTAALGIALAEQGELTAGIGQLDQAAAALRRDNAYLDLAHVLLWLARAYFLDHQQPLAESSLVEMMRLGRRLGCRPFALAEGSRALDVLRWGYGRIDSGAPLRGWLDDLQAQAAPSIEVAAAPAAGPHLEVRAFGAGQVWRDGRPLAIADWGGGAIGRELLFYLLERSPQRKQELGAVFWPDLSPARMTNAFHAAKYKTRRALGLDFAVYEDEAYRINPAANLWYDVAEFRRSIESARRRSGDDDARVADLRQAVALYAGDYLSDVYADWTADTRRTLQREYFEAVREMVDGLLQQGQYAEVLTVSQRALKFDFHHEDLHRAIMRSLAATGRVAEALGHFEMVAWRFKKDLDAPLTPETIDLAARLRAQSP